MSLAMVMAGTGELNVLRRLRIAHGHFSEGVTYGTHLSSHMALGLLFLGSGQYTLGTSNLAIAALVIAFFPSFPSTPMENRAHLQAYRHLWTLAVEARCLVARDVDTNEAAFLPVRLRLNDNSTTNSTGTSVRSLELVAPTLIPELRRINTIQIDSPRYWSFALHLSTNQTQLRNFLVDSTLYVKRRTGHLSYSQDPRGNRSIFTRSKSETGSSVVDFGETARLGGTGLGTTSGLKDFVQSFSDDQVAIAMVKYLCPQTTMTEMSEYEAFNASVLLECLTKDKPDTIGIYQAIFAAFSNSSSKSVQSLLGLEQLRLVMTFYQGGHYSKVFKTKGKSGKSTKEPLIQRTFIEHLASKSRAQSKSFLANPIARRTLNTYLKEFRWPIEGTALAQYLAAENAPDLNLLVQLRGLVTSVSSGDDDVKRAIKLVVRGTAKELQKKGGKAWSNDFGDLMVETWLECSRLDAIDAAE
jgi:anaphase-promoting complex subunit 1